MIAAERTSAAGPTTAVRRRAKPIGDISTSKTSARASVRISARASARASESKLRTPTSSSNDDDYN